MAQAHQLCVHHGVADIDIGEQAAVLVERLDAFSGMLRLWGINAEVPHPSGAPL